VDPTLPSPRSCYGPLTSCAAGRYNQYAGRTLASQCAQCAKGRYGRFSARTLASQCAGCPAGKTTSTTARTTAAQCTVSTKPPPPPPRPPTPASGKIPAGFTLAGATVGCPAGSVKYGDGSTCKKGTELCALWGNSQLPRCSTLQVAVLRARMTKRKRTRAEIELLIGGATIIKKTSLGAGAVNTKVQTRDQEGGTEQVIRGDRLCLRGQLTSATRRAHNTALAQADLLISP